MNTGNSDWKDEAYKAYLTKWEAHEAQEAARRRQDGQIAIWLKPAEEDAPVFSHEQQAELRAFVKVLREQEIEPRAPMMALDSAEAVGGYTGQFIIALAQVAAPVLTAALVTWINGKLGRKIIIEFYPGGSVKKVEAQSSEQAMAMLATVRAAVQLPPTINE